MARGNSKFPVEKPYLKVPRNCNSTNSSSLGKPDLSYSYSCVKAFKKNQHIIGNLATLHREHNFQGTVYQPTLYSLSGERQKPVCKPFYYSTLSESDEIGKCESNHNYYNADKLREDLPQEIQSDSEPDFPDTNLLLQWIKYQFKYVNLLWPFSRYKESLASKLCRKNRKMKMEMLLNNIDEETKCKLKKRVNDLNLSIEERFSLCNHSVIEIDITPILEDSLRLQDFLVFLKTIEASTSKEVKSKQQDDQRTFENKVMFENNLFTKQMNDRCNFFPKNKDYLKKTLGNNNGDHSNESIQCTQKNEVKNDILKHFNADYLDYSSNKRNIVSCTKFFKQDDYFSPQESHVSFSYTPKNHKLYKGGVNFESESFTKNLRSPHQQQDGFKKARFNSTIPTVKHIKIDKTIDSCYLTKLQQNNYKFCAQPEHSNYKEQNCKEPCKIRSSSNCTMYRKRRNIYNNQCILAKGDEGRNHFIKYATVKNKISKSKLFSFNHHSREKFHQSEGTATKRTTNQSTNGISTNNISDAKNKSTLRTRSHMVVDNDCDINSNNKLNYSNNNHNGKDEIKPSSSKLYHNKIRVHPYLTKSLRSSINSNKNENSNKIVLENGNETKYLSGIISNNLNINTVFQSPSCNFENDSTTVDRDTSVSNLHPSTCRLVRVEDVEKLVCAISYSDNSFSNQSLLDKRNINGQKKNRMKSDNYKQVSINACFESVDYSINSFAWNSSDTAKSFSIKQKGSSSFISCDKVFDNGGSSDLRLLFNSDGQRKNNINEKQSNNVMKHIFHGNLLSNYENTSQDHDNKTSLDMSKYCIKDHNYSFSNGNKEIKVTEEKQKKISEIVTNIKDLQRKISCMNERLTLLNDNQITSEAKGQYKCNTKNSSHNSTPKKMSLVIKIDSNDSGNNKIINQRQGRKYPILNSFKPKNIYRSISSIFKGTGKKYSRTKTNNTIKKCKNNSFDEDINISENSCNSFFKNDDCVNISCSADSLLENSNKSQLIESSLILKNLDRLYLELRNQRSDINNMKDLLNQSDQIKMFKRK